MIAIRYCGRLYLVIYCYSCIFHHYHNIIHCFIAAMLAGQGSFADNGVSVEQWNIKVEQMDDIDEKALPTGDFTLFLLQVMDYC